MTIIFNELMTTRRYGPLRGPTSSSCEGLHPLAEVIFALRAKNKIIMLFVNFQAILVSSSNLSNFKKNTKSPKKKFKIKKYKKNQKTKTNKKIKKYKTNQKLGKPINDCDVIRVTVPK